MPHYEVVDTDDVPLQDLSESTEMPPDLNIRAIDAALGTEQIGVKLWYFEPGEEIGYHAHSEQEELYFVLEGAFSLKLGRSGETEYVDTGPGTLWVAQPEIGHEHRNVGDESGVGLSFGAPPVDDPWLDPHDLGG